jgi:hypothetical protein
MDTNIIYIKDSSIKNEEIDLINLELYFPFNNSSIYIKINKYSTIQNIEYYINKHYGLFDISIIFNDMEIKNGTFISNNIKDNSKISIISNMKTGRINKSIFNQSIFNQSIIIDKKILDKNLQKILSGESNIDDDRKNKIKLTRNYYMSPIEDQRERPKLNREALENLGKKFKISMEEEIKIQDEKDKEYDKLKKKINDLKQKMRMSKNKKLGKKVNINENKKETFCGLKKGFLL